MREFTFVSVEAFLASVVVLAGYLTVQVYAHVTLCTVTLQKELAGFHLFSRYEVVAELTALPLYMTTCSRCTQVSPVYLTTYSITLSSYIV